MTTDYQLFADRRKAFGDAIIESTDSKKLIVAGPGTGKSYLFQEICKKNIEIGKNNNLTLTFINELVDDLSKDLHNLSEVQTLHSLALGKLPGSTGSNKMFIKLQDVICEDYRIIKGTKKNFNEILCNLIEDQEALEFYSKRRKYYNYFSSNCSVFTLLKWFEADMSRIPVYSQILIDEYQDFNKLESKLIEYLATKSPIVIVGDDDQSLYDFKYANPQDIRDKNNLDEYTSFYLPYCSRCTDVILHAYDNIVSKAKEEGYMLDRVDKEYLYFPSKEKDIVSNKNSKIIVKRKVYQTTLAYNIDDQIKAFSDLRSKELPTILIICPLKKQIEPLEKALRSKGYKNIDAAEKKKDNILIDGLNLLLNDSKSNLGWRILFQEICDREGWEERIKEVLEINITTDDEFSKLLTIAERKIVKTILSSLRKIINNEEIDQVELDLVCKYLNHNPNEITKTIIREEMDEEKRKKNLYKNTPIKITSILGSKGLTRDYSFLVNFDDKYLLDKNSDGQLAASDSSICRFLVALTRAKAKIYLFTSENDLPTYMKWIDEKHIDEI